MSAFFGPRFSLGPPSVGERLLSRATTCELTFHRWPASERDGELDEPSGDLAAAEQPVETSLSFELRGQLPLAGTEAAALLWALAAEFTKPPRGGKRGAQ